MSVGVGIVRDNERAALEILEVTDAYDGSEVGSWFDAEEEGFCMEGRCMTS